MSSINFLDARENIPTINLEDYGFFRMITKTDFLRYLDTPMHLWAEKHDQLETVLSPFNQHLLKQGKEIEKLGEEFLIRLFAAQGLDPKIDREQTFKDRNFQARVDVIVFDSDEDVYDLYEIKSSTSIKKEHKYDVAFQRLVCEATISVRNVFIVHVNKEFIRDGALDVSSFFTLLNMNDEIEKLRNEVAAARKEAWKIAESDTPEGISECMKPKDCPCPKLCHPELPEFSIFELARLHKNKLRELKGSGVLAIQDIPDDFPLTERQQKQAAVVKVGKPLINYSVIKAELGKLEYPLYFLDYETFNPGEPWYEGYKPHQHMVFQYSLHTVASYGTKPEHFEFLSTDAVDPGIKIVEHLSRHIGETGSVIVWNKPFEAGKNREMAERYPDYREALENINDRIFDLMEIFSKGYFIHPDFHGSASIKKVFPVLVQDNDLNYEELSISKGDAAMMAWKEIMTGETAQKDIPKTRQDLLRYCEQDSIAMVMVWEVLENLVREGS